MSWDGLLWLMHDKSGVNVGPKWKWVVLKF